MFNIYRDRSHFVVVVLVIAVQRMNLNVKILPYLYLMASNVARVTRFREMH